MPLPTSTACLRPESLLGNERPFAGKSWSRPGGPGLGGLLSDLSDLSDLFSYVELLSVLKGRNVIFLPEETGKVKYVLPAG